MFVMVKIQETSKGQKTVTLPSKIAQSMNWDKGKEVEWKIHDKNNLRLEDTDNKTEDEGGR